MAKAKRRTRRKPQPKTGNSIWLWGVVGVAAVAGIYAYQHRGTIPSSVMAYAGVAGTRHDTAEQPPVAVKPKPKPVMTASIVPERPAERVTSDQPIPPNAIPVSLPVQRSQTAASPAPDGERFGLCGNGPGINCVVDGNTFWQDGIKIRLADIDVPNSDPSQCAGERQKAGAARLRLQTILNNGTFALSASGRGDDQYGGKYRIAM
ncbi:MAG: thermonuclease family protein, partial [Rhizobiaceae bacterium]|nr:thermonuclease family protein [Rhizobiaceae bacterium]